MPQKKNQEDEARAGSFAELERSAPRGASQAWWRRLIYLVVPPRRQRNRPTVAGWLLILIAISIGVVAYNTASNILFLVLSFVFALLIVNGVLSVLNFQKLDWDLSLPTESRARETITASLRLKNCKRFYSTRAVWFVVKVGKQESKRVYLKNRIPAGGSESVYFTFSCEKRGREKIRVEGPESTFPFGFLKKQTGAFVAKEILVWPAADPRPTRIPDPRRTTRMGGVHRRVGSGTDLLHLRGYEKGDPLRQIHWKATARTGNLMIRQMADEGSGSFILHVDCAESIWPDKDIFELLLSRASTLASRLFTQNRLDGYVFNQEGFRKVRHVSELNEFNDKLALAEQIPGRSRVSVPGANLVRFTPSDSGGVGLELGG